MKIAIIVPDQMVVIDGLGFKLPDIDWNVFLGAEVAWDDIRAVQFDTDAGVGHVEYCEIVTNPPTRPNIIPANRVISAEEFAHEFGFVLPHWEAAKVRFEAEEQAAAEARAAARLAPSDDQPRPAADPDEIAALKAEIAGLKDDLAAFEEGLHKARSTPAE